MTKHFIMLSIAITPLAVAEVDYGKEILPILEENCYDCHNEDKSKAALRLDQRGSMLRGGDSGIATLVPGHPEKSFLMEVITGEPDPEMQMPPKGDPLSDEQIKLIEIWIREGAQWPGQMDAKAEFTSDLWSLKAVERPDVSLKKGEMAIDALLKAKLVEADLEFSPTASREDLIRRISILLTGLPPTPERIASFLADSEQDSEKAYAALVDELLASPHFGERWAQHWLDVIRWAETNGSEANLYRKNAWIYRDYLIRAFNDDIPYDQFVKEQLAGDQLGAGEATGFLVAGPHVPAATVGREPTAIRQARADRMDEIMQTVGASMLGMTVSCARCHNHKFDPITIQDYYSLTAVFQGVEFGGRYPELAETHPRKKRAKELYPAMFKERRTLRDEVRQWSEDWGGYFDHHFPVQKTKALKVMWFSRNVGVDELDVFGPDDYNHNFALASRGTVLKTGEGMTKKGNEVWKANDGQIGTMAFRTDLPKDSKEKPYIEIHFPEEIEVNRFRYSGNREYYFETDYVQVNRPKLGGFKVFSLQENGEWKEVGSDRWAMELLKKNEKAKKAKDRLQNLIGSLQEEGPRHSFVGKFAEPVVTKVLHRGSPESPRDEVMPAGFEIMKGDLGLDSTTPDPDRRLKFAEWLVRSEHPLTARVMVNRVWHHLFGLGIVPTTSDFGVAGAAPTNQPLLDYLAAEFVIPSDDAKPWGIKDLIRKMVLTEAFQQSSAPNEKGLATDAGAALLWRFPPRRVEAEVIRDSILQASGKLDPKLGGRSYRIHNVKKTYAQWEVVDNYSDPTWRRMIYQERMRRVDDKIFTAFDFPDCGQVRAKRPVSTTPLQALNLMNSPYVISQSKYVAERAKNEAKEDPVTRTFELLVGRAPTKEEKEACQGVELSLVARSLINSNEFAFLP